MPKLLQINITSNSGATGKITEEIGAEAIRHGWESYVAYSRGIPISQSNLVTVGSRYDMRRHGLLTRLTDAHGLGSAKATKALIERIRTIGPDIIHLHNIHGYYLNYPRLFDYLREWGGLVVWTLHDCWAFTGHCAHFEDAGCRRWEVQCHHCPLRNTYPISWFADRSTRNYLDRKAAFTSLPNLTLVSPSKWLDNILGRSFLAGFDRRVIHNGIDINLFHPYGQPGQEERMVLATAWVWNRAKGLDDLINLSRMLPANYRLCIVGLSEKQRRELPSSIKGITRTENQKALAQLYSKASVFVNPTYGDTFPTTNLESLACGTPVVTYRTGGSPEAISESTGRVVERADIPALYNAIIELGKLPQKELSRNCRRRAEELFDQRRRFVEYVDLYDSLIG